LTTDSHDGTDFRLRRFQDLDRDVKVVAAAAGTVLRVRDGMPDISVKEAAAPVAPDRMAGNAVVVGHGEGWETQYSHLKRGSVRVRPGQPVVAGAELGVVGLSGNTEYPHVHFEVRHNGRAVDPFAAGEPTGCDTKQASLWTAAAAKALAYHSTVVLSAGFATAPAGAKPEAGQSPEVIKDPQNLFLWGNVSGVQSGDVEKFRILAPNGGVIVARDAAILRTSLVWVGYAGARRPVGGWQLGKYSGTYQLVRNGVLVGELSMTQYITG
jgi:murein DD-endopeptidase MepM/ murein hydrolase activator NlpD